MNRTGMIGVLLCVALVAFGCSSSTDSELRNGDPADPIFLQSQPYFDSVITDAVGGLDLAMDFYFNPPDSASAISRRTIGPIQATPAVDTFSYSYNSVTGWHVAYAAASIVGFNYTELDSVQFQDVAGQHMQFPDSGVTDLVHAISHIGLTSDDTLPQQFDFAQDFNLTLAGLTTNQITANGNIGQDFAGSFSDTSMSCNATYTFSQEVTDVSFVRPTSEVAGVCPNGGTLHFAGTVNLACTGGQGEGTYNQSWAVDVTFNPDATMDVRAVSGNTLWEYSGDTPCGNYSGQL